MILKGHGVLCLSPLDVMDACYKLECLEAVGQAILVTKALGGAYRMTPREIEGVRALLAKKWRGRGSDVCDRSGRRHDRLQGRRL